MNNKEENYIGLGENLRECLSCQEKISETDFYEKYRICLLYTSPSPRDLSTSRMPSSA